MTMAYWFVPTHRGDIRLERLDNGCFIAIKDASSAEQAILKRFTVAVRERGWLSDVAELGESTSGREQRISIPHPMNEVGQVLVQAAFGEANVWTAVRTADSISLVDGTTVPATAEAAVSVREPNRGCPAPVPTNERASEVLRTFSTAAQWKEWERTSSMIVVGNHTGRPYRVYHRNAAVRRGLGHIAVNADGVEVCVWDARVPAEEEVLSTKLAIEHRERWVFDGSNQFLAPLAETTKPRRARR